MDLIRQNSIISETTLTAYINADYVVLTETPFTLKIGCYSPELKALYQHFNDSSAAFLTAYNPFSNIESDTDNAQANQRLIAELTKRNLRYISGVGRDPKGLWADEASHLVLGLTLADSKDIAAHFRQNALVWVDHNAIPELILMR